MKIEDGICFFQIKECTFRIDIGYLENMECGILEWTGIEWNGMEWTGMD